MFTLLGVAVGAAYHVVSAFAQVLAPLPGGLAAAAAIVVFTLAVRLLLLPLSYYAIRGQASQARLAPQVQALRKRHAGHPERLQRELAALYQREGTGVFAGFLPLLLQLPFLSVVYALFRSGTIGGRPNGLLSHDLLGAPLGSHWLSGPGPLSAQGAVFLGLFALLAVAAWLAARVARKIAAQQVPPQPAPAGAAGWLARALPYTTLVIAAIMPLAAGLYLLTTTAWAAAERAMLAPRVRRHVRARSRSA
jgi:YidC/Oxa1 family membrane protein insertase